MRTLIVFGFLKVFKKSKKPKKWPKSPKFIKIRKTSNFLTRTSPPPYFGLLKVFVKIVKIKICHKTSTLGEERCGGFWNQFVINSLGTWGSGSQIAKTQKNESSLSDIWVVKVHFVTFKKWRRFSMIIDFANFGFSKMNTKIDKTPHFFDTHREICRESYII